MTDSTAPNPSTAQAVVLADELVRSGVRNVVVAPGSRSAALAIAFHRAPGLRTHVHPDERSAGFVALGIGLASGTPAVVLVTSGTAVANLLPAAVEADRSGTPLLVLTADRPPELRDTGANQTVQQVGMLGPGMRWSSDLPVAEDREDAVRTWRSSAARAVAIARGDGGSLPGPVHLNIPTREPTVPVEDDGRTRATAFRTSLAGRPGGMPWVQAIDGRSAPATALVERLADRLLGVRRGLIVVGGPVGMHRARVSAGAADALAKALGWPVVAEVITDARSGAAALGAGSWLLSDRRFLSVQRPDLVLMLGRATLDERWSVRLGVDVPRVLIDPHGAWHDPGRVVSEQVVADPDALLRAVAEAVSTRRAGTVEGDWLARWRDMDREVLEVLDTMLGDPGPLTGLHVARLVGDAVPAGVPLVAASSLTVRDLDAVHRGRSAVPVHANRGAAGIDGTISTMLGVAVGGTGAAWGLVGDLALLHDANGFLLQPEAPEPRSTVFVVDNGGGRIFTRLPLAAHAPAFERLFVAPPERDLMDVARLHRLSSSRVRTVSDLAGVTAGAAPELVVATVEPDADAEFRARVTTAVADRLRANEVAAS